MRQRVSQFANWLQHQLKTWCLARMNESRHCSDCAAVVSPWDQVCPNCGMASPARIRLSPTAYAAFGLAVLATLVVVQWI